MNESANEHMFPQSRQTLVQLTGIPVDQAFTKRLLKLLELHGAKATHTNTAQRYLEDGKTSTYHEFTIDFPAGTQREDGMMLYRSAPFTIYFPDGYELPGVEFPSISVLSEKKSLIILHIPR
jgi:hypothetical protein